MTVFRSLCGPVPQEAFPFDRLRRGRLFGRPGGAGLERIRWRHGSGRIVGHFLARWIDIGAGIEVTPIGADLRFHRDLINDFEVEPPFLDRIKAAVTVSVVQPCGERHQYGLQPHRFDAEPCSDLCIGRSVKSDNLA